MIGLCKAVESEVVNRVLVPLANKAISADSSHDKNDKDIGRVAAFCIDFKRRPPELGVFAHFLQTVIHSSQRRRTSPLEQDSVKTLPKPIALRPENLGHHGPLSVSNQELRESTVVDEIS